MAANPSTRTTNEVNPSLAKNPSITYHCTAAGSSCWNRYEIWFGITTRRAIRRRTFISVTGLVLTTDLMAAWGTNARLFT
ncbi:hypothetical protein [Micromonospora rhizosphaerae]|uniref:hypothetical protein n=1 Tax=Micromonospora rhizosphaerae TaxID=568872 RepID=UPI000B877E42|nr:hypothetical protein [Micromonospora rhizosphaerae]